MKLIRKDYPKVRQYQKHGKNYFAVDLRRKHYNGQKFKNFTAREDALTYAASVGQTVVKDGLNAINVVGLDPRVADWQSRCAIFGKTIDQAIDAAVKIFEREREIKDSPFMGELLTLWVDDKKTGLKKLRPKSLKSLSSAADVFKKTFTMTRIKEIDQEAVETYLKDSGKSDQTKENYRNLLGQFFNWAIKKNHFTGKNPAEDIEIEIVRDTPEFYTVEQCKTILREASKDENQHMRAFFALGLFAGIRPDEISRLTWEKNIKMDTKEIYIQAKISKTKKDRLFKMEDNLFTWLQSLDQNKPLVPERTEHHRKTVCAALPLRRSIYPFKTLSVDRRGVKRHGFGRMEAKKPQSRRFPRPQR